MDQISAYLPGLVGGLAGGLLILLLSKLATFISRNNLPESDNSDTERQVKGDLKSQVQSLQRKHETQDVRLRDLSEKMSGRVNWDQLEAKLKPIREDIDGLRRSEDKLRKDVSTLQEARSKSGASSLFSQARGYREPQIAPDSEAFEPNRGGTRVSGQPRPATLPQSAVSPSTPPLPVAAVPRPPLPEVILEHFDEVDAASLRDLEKFKLAFKQLAGPRLVDVVDKDGAYIFVVSDGTCYVHPKPNTTLMRIWEPAFPGASSYSRPLAKVVRLARIREQGEQEYVVLDKGIFEVVS